MLNRLRNASREERKKERKEKKIRAYAHDEHETTTKSRRNPPRMELSFEFLPLGRSFGTNTGRRAILSRGGNPFGMINAREDSEFRGQARPRYAREGVSL